MNYNDRPKSILEKGMIHETMLQNQTPNNGWYLVQLLQSLGMKEPTDEEYESELLVVEGAIRHSIIAFRTWQKSS